MSTVMTTVLTNALLCALFLVRRLVGDTAWHPMPRSEYESLGDGGKVAVQVGLGPLRFLASIGHWYVPLTLLL